LVDLTPKQKEIVTAEGHMLVTGGPGSGKTTVSIIKAAKIAREQLKPGQKVLFLSFARATVSRVLEAIGEEDAVSNEARRRIDVDTYHSFFWQIIKTHGYLLGFPRRLSLLTPPNEAIALASIRRHYKTPAKLIDVEKKEKAKKENDERMRLAREDGRVCFDLFAPTVGDLLHRSAKVSQLVSNAYPFIILDEFQDTNADQWRVVRALGKTSTLIALADPEQRIFEFIGADPERLNHFRQEFKPNEFDLAGDNHRSKGTELSLFGNDILKGKFSQKSYNGVNIFGFESNADQALATVTTHTLKARERLIESSKRSWSLAILVPTKRMTRFVSDEFRAPFGKVPPIAHASAVDMEGPILGAEVIALLLQPHDDDDHLPTFIECVRDYFRGKDGDTPTQTGLDMADSVRKAFDKCMAARASGKALPKASIFLHMQEVYEQIRALKLTGDPDADWRTVRLILENGGCPRLREIAEEVRNVRLLDRGTQLRQALAQDWRENGTYANALEIVRLAFVQEHFSTAHKPETGVVVMNMHKAKGKQFDEVIIFEGWPRRVKGKGIVANPDRIIWDNKKDKNVSQARQNFRVSVTRAKQRTTILTPKDDPCVLLRSD
jgi:ATP-dependent DNA helicase UvrD/PcrA